MTKSTITRERIEQYAKDPRMCNINDEIREMARMALAAMDSEPAVFTDERNLHHIAMGRETSLIWGKQNSEAGDIPLYRHAQQPVVPDGLIAAVDRLLDSDGSRGCYSAIRCHDARAEVERLLAAAPQEVK
ncbi:hypothetical protein OND23_005529 [Klebsiella oxytoca]